MPGFLFGGYGLGQASRQGGGQVKSVGHVMLRGWRRDGGSDCPTGRSRCSVNHAEDGQATERQALARPVKVIQGKQSAFNIFLEINNAPKTSFYTWQPV